MLTHLAVFQALHSQSLGPNSAIRLGFTGARCQRGAAALTRTSGVGHVTACWFAPAGRRDSAIEGEGVADEAVGADVGVVEPSGCGVVFVCVPVQPCPALCCRFLPQGVEESPSHTNASSSGIDVKVLQETRGLCAPREGVQDADREAGEALGVSRPENAPSRISRRTGSRR